MWSTKEIGAALNLSPIKELSISNFQFDSRNVQPGDCFIALPGIERDGHDFINEARRRGATCVIGQKDADFLVPDSYQALNQLALYAKKRSPAKRIAITGSIGKTTTTSFLAQLLQQNHASVFPEGSFNNHIGVPLTITKLTPDTEFGIFEIGTNHSGEVKPLADLVSPDIAIITKIGTAHIGHFGSQKEIAREKAQILYALPDNGIGIVPDDAFLSIYQESKKNIVVMPPPQDLLPTIPKRLQGNVAMAKKAAELLGAHDFDLTKLSIAQCSQGRGAIYTKKINDKMVTIVDDAYNAAFDSLMASLNDFSTMPGRKIIVVGDMGELGAFSESYHQQIANKIKSLPHLAHVIPLGPLMSAALNINTYPFETVTQVLRELIKENDVILFKGSKASGASKILHQLIADEQLCK